MRKHESRMQNKAHNSVVKGSDPNNGVHECTWILQAVIPTIDRL